MLNGVKRFITKMKEAAGGGPRLALLAVLLAGLCLSPVSGTHAHKGGDDSLDDPGQVALLRDIIINTWLPAYNLMTQQFTVVMMHQMVILGAFFDAKQQLETQTLLQQMMAEAHKDYHPSMQMCRIGTNVRSLAASEARYRANTQILEAGLMQRETLSANAPTSTGPDSDKRSRLRKFASTYCDVNDNNGALRPICVNGSGPSVRINKDVDYTRTIENTLTLDINFLEPPFAPATPDEEDVVALAHNLFAHDTFTRIPERHLMQDYGKDELLDTRSVHAMRSVVFNSYSHIVGMRARGSEEPGQVGPFMKSIIAEMRVPEGEINLFLGEFPSYFAQMEVLTKKLYQNPTFFTQLYDKPANVDRIGVSIQAIKLMHDRDRFESALRREMLISLILELKLREEQKNISNNILTSVSSFLGDPVE